MKISNYCYVLGLSMLVACSGVKEKTKLNVIPLPQEVYALGGTTEIKAGDSYTIICNDSIFANTATELNTLLSSVYGLTPADKGKVSVVLVKKDMPNKEAYQMEINDNKISIEAPTNAGAFYALQTLKQLFPLVEDFKANKSIVLEKVQINDFPKFAYRGTHLDVGRHFVTADSVKRFIDILAMHKMNTFHWHLTEDQGWRLEIKKYPKLTEIGSHRPRTVIGRNSGEFDNVPHGGFYTQDEVRDIVKYASDRNITVIPEVDLPGHMIAALASYPELGCKGKDYKVEETFGVFDDVLCAGNTNTYTFISDVLDEVIELFPSTYIHVGGDECPKVRWQACPKCQAKIDELNIRNPKDSLDHHTAEERLQAHVIKYAEKHLNSKGRKLIGWDEIMEGGLSETATLMAWRGANYAFEAAAMGNDAVLTPGSHCYFDHYQTDDQENEPLAIGGCTTLEHVYSYVPVADTVSADIRKHILGVQANLWTEYMKNFRQVEYMLLPRLAALSEINWTDGTKDYEDFLLRLSKVAEKYDEQNYNYAKHIFNVRYFFNRDSVTSAQSLAMEALNNADIYYTIDGTEPTRNSLKYSEPVVIDHTMKVRAKAFTRKSESQEKVQDFVFNKATAKPIETKYASHKAYTNQGANTLNDGVTGLMNYKAGRWMGYNGADLDATIDLLQEESIDKVNIRTLVVTGDWIFPPKAIRIYTSKDGKEFSLAKEQTIIQPTKHISEIKDHEIALDQTSARYVRIELESQKDMPEWHVGKGKPAFLFVDEISIL
ncbi:MAG: glycoside hydrolase family 20 protein [Bacteroidales bacterium]